MGSAANRYNMKSPEKGERNFFGSAIQSPKKIYEPTTSLKDGLSKVLNPGSFKFSETYANTDTLQSQAKSNFTIPLRKVKFESLGVQELKIMDQQVSEFRKLAQVGQSVAPPIGNNYSPLAVEKNIANKRTKIDGCISSHLKNAIAASHGEFVKKETPLNDIISKKLGLDPNTKERQINPFISNWDRDILYSGVPLKDRVFASQRYAGEETTRYRNYENVLPPNLISADDDTMLNTSLESRKIDSKNNRISIMRSATEAHIRNQSIPNHVEGGSLKDGQLNDELFCDDEEEVSPVIRAEAHMAESPSASLFDLRSVMFEANAPYTVATFSVADFDFKEEIKKDQEMLEQGQMQERIKEDIDWSIKTKEEGKAEVKSEEIAEDFKTSKSEPTTVSDVSPPQAEASENVKFSESERNELLAVINRVRKTLQQDQSKQDQLVEENERLRKTIESLSSRLKIYEEKYGQL